MSQTRRTSGTEGSEITLGTGRLLGIFFALVVTCALFFVGGFAFGRNTGSETASAATTASPESAAIAKATAAATAEANKPVPEELTFYKAVEQKDPEPKLEPVEQAPPPVLSKPSPIPAKRAAAVGSSSGYMVQVAAVSKQEDAEALAAALRGKKYRVTTTGVPTDRLIHVQIGPFADVKAAEAMRQKLKQDGYNPIVKK